MNKTFFEIILEGIVLMEQDGEKKGFRWGRAALGAAGLGALGAATGGFGGVLGKAAIAATKAGRRGGYLGKKLANPIISSSALNRKLVNKRFAKKIVGLNRPAFRAAARKGASIGLGAGIFGGAALGFQKKDK